MSFHRERRWSQASAQHTQASLVRSRSYVHPSLQKQDERLGNRIVTVGIEQYTSTTGAGHVDSAKNQVLLWRKKGKWFLFIDNSLGHSNKVCLALRWLASVLSSGLPLHPPEWPAFHCSTISCHTYISACQADCGPSWRRALPSFLHGQCLPSLTEFLPLFLLGKPLVDL